MLPSGKVACTTRRLGGWLAALLLLPIVVWAQGRRITDDYLVRLWTVESGYPHIAPTSMAETPDGYLWIGSFSNLTRFDGIKFEVVAPPEAPALKDAMVIHMHTAKDGSLWAATNRGVGRLHQGRWTWFGPGEGLPAGPPFSLGEWRGQIFVTIGGKAFLCSDGRTFQTLPTPAEPRREILGARLVAAPDDQMWLINPQEVYLRRDDSWELVLSSQDPSEQFGGAAFAANGDLLLAAKGRILRWRAGKLVGETPRPAALADDYIELKVDAADNLWFGSFTGGALLRRTDGIEVPVTMADGLENHSIMRVFEDSQRNIWLATNGGGLARLRPRRFAVFDRQVGLAQPVVNSLAAVGPDEYIVATHGGGLQRLRGGRFTPWVETDPALVRAVGSWPHTVVRESDGRLWVGTYGNGLIAIEPQGGFQLHGRAEVGDEVVDSLHLAADGRLWIGGRTGIAVREQGGRFRRFDERAGVPTGRYQAWTEDSTGQVWVAGRACGLLTWDGNRFTRVPLPGDARGAAALYADKAGRLWVGLADKGLAVRYRGVWRLVDERAGLPSVDVSFIREDANGNFWIGTGRGVFRLEAASVNAFLRDGTGTVRSVLLDQADGLPFALREGFHPLTQLDADGVLRFATMRGLATVDLSQVLPEPVTPPTRLLGWSVGGLAQPLPEPGDDFTLPPGSSRVGFSFTAIDLGQGETLRFEYRLGRPDAAWVPAGSERRVEFFDLKPGQYEFAVRAVAKEGRPGPAATVGRLVVEPHYWQTEWFMTLVLTSVAALVAALAAGVLSWRHRARVARLAQEHREAEERVRAEHLRREQATVDSANRVKSDFFTVMSHEIRTPLNGVMGAAELLDDAKLDEVQREHLETLRSSAENLLGIMNDILDFSRLEAGNVVLEAQSFDPQEPAREAVEAWRERAHEKELEIVLCVEPEVPARVVGDAARIRQILHKLVANAVKFTSAGHVVLRIGTLPGASDGLQRLEYSVADTGVGIVAEKLAHLFDRMTQAGVASNTRFGGAGLGLAICRHLVDLMGGRIRALSAPGAGSRFFVTIDLRVEAHAAYAPPVRWRALLLERDADAAEALVFLGRRAGVEVVALGDASEVSAQLRNSMRSQRPLEVLLADETTLLLAGSPLARALHDEAELRHVPVVVLSARGARAGNLAEFAVVAVQRKPLLRTEELVALLERAVAAPRAVRAKIEPVAATRPVVEIWCRALVVEDDPASRYIAQRLLERMGCSVDLAKNGQEAMEMTARHRYDVVLMDCRMPVMDGYEATAAIRRRDAAAMPVIIALTANTSAADKRRCLDLGMMDFLSKPVRREELEQVLTRHVRRPLRTQDSQGQTG